MSKIGKKPISVPDGVEVKVVDGVVTVRGPKGELSIDVHPNVKIEQTDHELKLSVPRPEDSRQKALWGTTRALLQNMVGGVVTGFEKKLEIQGIGYRASVAGNKLVLSVGFSHPVEIPIPKTLEVKVEKNVIRVSGINKQEVGQFASLVRSTRKPEPYKGKGIKYEGEVIRRKAGKVVKTVGG